MTRPRSQKISRSNRTPEEERARGACRLLVRSLGSRLMKVEKTHVSVKACDKWPVGIVTAFNGWEDLLNRLEFCRDNPDYVTDGVYVSDSDDSMQDELETRAVRMRHVPPPDASELAYG